MRYNDDFHNSLIYRCVPCSKSSVAVTVTAVAAAATVPGAARKHGEKISV